MNRASYLFADTDFTLFDHERAVNLKAHGEFDNNDLAGRLEYLGDIRAVAGDARRRNLRRRFSPRRRAAEATDL